MPRRIFVGSSTESLPIAQVLSALLSDADTIVDLWSNIFDAGNIIIDRLLESAGRCDFAIFVIARDDITTVRGSIHSTVRDNVIFEAGIFMGKLGRQRTFLVVPVNHDDGGRAKILSDLSGYNYETLNIPKDKSDYKSSFLPACVNLNRAMANIESDLLFENSRMRSLNGEWSGTMEQEIGGKSQTLPIAVKFWPRLASVLGELTISGVNIERYTEITVSLEGRFVRESFLKFDYKYSNIPGSMQFGSIILGFNGLGSRLSGKFAGYGAFSEAIISGTINISKVL